MFLLYPLYHFFVYSFLTFEKKWWLCPSFHQETCQNLQMLFDDVILWCYFAKKKKKAYNEITDLQEDIRQLSDELYKKDSLLSGFTSRFLMLSTFVVADRSASPPHLSLSNW